MVPSLSCDLSVSMFQSVFQSVSINVSRFWSKLGQTAFVKIFIINWFSWLWYVLLFWTVMSSILVTLSDKQCRTLFFPWLNGFGMLVTISANVVGNVSRKANTLSLSFDANSKFTSFFHIYKVFATMLYNNTKCIK